VDTNKRHFRKSTSERNYVMKLASIEKVTKVFPHPNADKLEFVHVLGYDCLVPKGLHELADLVVLIQPDTVLPQVPWTEIYRKASAKRVKAIRLRGEWSFGIVEKLSLLPEATTIAEGVEVSELLNITKYEPPVPVELNAKGFLPFGIPKTDEERYQNLPLEEYLSKSVDVTLKVDGQSFTAYYKDGAFGVCGRTLEYKLEFHNDYTAHVKRYDLENKLRTFCEKHSVDIALRGESYGKGVQTSKTNPHSHFDKGVMFFGVWLIAERRYALKGDKFYIHTVAEELGLPVVPMLECDVPLTLDLIKKYDDGLENLNGAMFEGVVLVGEDFSFKVINKIYDSAK
jgi:RNA ligase (TIGR02306 family)